LKVGEDSGFGFGGLCWCGCFALRSGFCGWKIFRHVEECTDNAGAGFADFDFGREGAVGWVEGDLFDGFDLGRGFAAWQGFGEV
jgi:hypothetical protein